MTCNYLTPGGVCKCIFVEHNVASRYGATVVQFVNLLNGQQFELIAEKNPGIVVDKDYRLEIIAVELED